MADKNSINETQDQTLDEEARARRDFLKKVGVTAATAPAIGILLASTPTKANADVASGCGCGGGSIL